MADEQLGITIKFRGESVEFSNDLKGIDNSIKLLQKDAKNLNKQLKLDPNNSKLLEEYFTNLKQQASQLSKEIDIYKQKLDGMPEIKTADQVKEMENLIGKLADAETRLQKVNHQIELFNVQDVQIFANKLGEIGKQLTTIGDLITGIGKSFALLSTASASALAVGIKYNAEMEQYTIALTTALGSEAKALETIEQIKKDATKTPWGVNELVEYNRTLIATGLSAEESEDIILSLGDAVSAVGGTSDVFSRMVQNLQQIKNAGNATAMDIRQFANAGIDIYGILSDYLGKTTDQISEQDRTWENIIGALKMASSEGGKYFGAMESQSTSLTSQLNKLKDEFQQALGEITESLLPTLKSLVAHIKSIATWLKNLTPQQKELLGKILAITAAISPLLIGIGSITSHIGGLFIKLKNFLKSDSTLTWLSSLRTSITNTGGVLEFLKSGLTSTIGIIGAVVTAFVLMYTQSESFRNAINNLVSTLGEMFMPILENLKIVFNSLWSILTETLIPAFLSLFETLGNILAPVIRWYNDYLASTLNPILQALGNLVSNVLVLAFNLLKTKIELIINVIKYLFNGFKDLYDKFKETSAFEAISNSFNAVIEIIKTMIGWVKSLIDWISSAVNWLANLFSYNGKSVDVNVNSSNGGGGGNTRSSRSGGFGDSYMSGGYNFTINVTNQGGSLTANNIKGWARMLTDQINENLGKEM